VFQGLTIDTQLDTVERDADARVYGKPAVLQGKHGGNPRSVEQVSEPKPADHAAPYPLGERDQMDLSDRMRRQEGRPPVAVWHEDAIGRTHVQVHMAVERRAEAVQEEDGAVSRAGGWEGVGVNRYACRSTRLLPRLGQAFEIPVIDYDWLFSATVQRKTAGMRNRE
jgi:hypothetical protein